MSRRPVTMMLTPRRRNVLCLRAAGMSNAQIGAYLGINQNIVRKDIAAITDRLIPGSTDQGEAKGYRLTYILGLIDSGVPAEDVPSYIDALLTRVDMRLAQNVPVRAGTPGDSGDT